MGKVLIWFVIIISTVVLYCLMKVKAESDELYEKLVRKHFYGRSDDSSYETGTTATVSFKQTNSPSSTSKTTAFSGEAANVKFLVKIQGKIIQQYTGMDGFTVFGGKMIVTYR